MAVEVTFVCEDCGKRETVNASPPTCWYSRGDGTGYHSAWIGTVRLPPSWNGGLNQADRCNACYDAWQERMRPVWEARRQQMEREQDATVKGVKRSRKALVEELKRIKKDGCRVDLVHDRLGALIRVLEG